MSQFRIEALLAELLCAASTIRLISSMRNHVQIFQLLVQNTRTTSRQPRPQWTTAPDPVLPRTVQNVCVSREWDHRVMQERRSGPQPNPPQRATSARRAYGLPGSNKRAAKHGHVPVRAQSSGERQKLRTCFESMLRFAQALWMADTWLLWRFSLDSRG